jgi:L-alanine-DL-glutamate epimerase-like enolase superfamily enzyme
MCRAVREAVGPDVDLMLDSHHCYTRTEAKRIGDMNFRWFEEPMDEHSMSAYEWLSNEVDVPILGPETAEGKHQTRAEWAKRGIADIGRVGVFDVGGTRPPGRSRRCMKHFTWSVSPMKTHLPNSTTSVRCPSRTAISSTASSIRSTTTPNGSTN